MLCASSVHTPQVQPDTSWERLAWVGLGVHRCVNLVAAGSNEWTPDKQACEHRSTLSYPVLQLPPSNQRRDRQGNQKQGQNGQDTVYEVLEDQT
eukprot:1159196-Pelagomonas_calceolata.AAC.2